MPTINIPKLARNKYNCVIGTDGNKYVTQSQLATRPNGGGSGTGTGTSHKINSNAMQTNPQLRSMIDDSAYTTKDLCYAYATSEAMIVQANCYAYTYSRTQTSDIEDIVNQIIAAKLLSGELISAAGVDQKIQDSRV